MSGVHAAAQQEEGQAEGVGSAEAAASLISDVP